ncbi:MAG: YncE family protein [Ktedonobacteraceae bacterium]
MGIAASSSAVYTVNSGTDSVSVIDPVTGQIRNVLKVGWGPCALVLSPDGKRLYTADSWGNSITVMDVDATGNLQFVQILLVQKKPIALAHHPNASTQRLYVVCQDDNSLLEIDTNALQVINTLAIGQNPMGVALTPDGTEAWVALNGSSQIAIVSTSLLQIATNIAVIPAPRDIAIASDGKRAYATQPTNNGVVVLDMVRRMILATPQLESSPSDIAVALDGTSVYVSSKERDRIFILQPDGAVKGTIEVGQGADNLMVLSATRLYAVNRGISVVNVIDLQTNTVVAAWQLGTGLGEYLTWLLVQGQSTQASLDSDTTPTVQLSGIHAGPALVEAIYVLPGNTPPYTFVVRLRDENNAPIIRKEQYDLIMNILNVFHPIGVEMLTAAIRRYVIEVRGQLINIIPDYTYPNFRVHAPLPK